MNHDYFSAFSNSDLMRVVLSLAEEVYVLADRQAALETIIAKRGIDLAPLDALTDAAAFDEGAKAKRDAFVGRVLASLVPAG